MRVLVRVLVHVLVRILVRVLVRVLGRASWILPELDLIYRTQNFTQHKHTQHKHTYHLKFSNNQYVINLKK